MIKNFTVALDWLQFGLMANPWSEIGKTCGWEDGPGNRFYESSFRPMPGATIWRNLREGFVGRENMCFSVVELKGEYFSCGGKAKIFLDWAEDTGEEISLQRVDVAVDVFQEIKHQKVKVRGKTAFVQYFGRKQKYQGFKLGKGERVLRLYDKALEDGVDPEWWRCEIALRGSWAKRIIDLSEFGMLEAGMEAMADEMFCKFPPKSEIGKLIQLLSGKNFLRDPEKRKKATFEGKLEEVVGKFRAQIEKLAVEFSPGGNSGLIIDSQTLAEWVLDQAMRRPGKVTPSF